MIEHQAVVNLLEAFRRELSLTSSDVVLGFTTFCFDISVLEIFLPLMIGARLHMVSATTQKDAGALVDIIDDPSQGITFVQATPATFEMLMHFGWKGNPRVQCLCGGEAFRLNLGPLVARCKAFRNGYGPTEATIYSTVYKLPGPPTGNVPIGEAVDGYSLHIFDTETLRPVEDGEAGELFIGGIGLARGYYNRADLTSEKFIANPFGQGRLYRSGDLCKWRKGSEASNDGVVLYLGRLDGQVKINGYRIELGEVETRLQAHDDVGAAVVLAREDVLPTGARALVAYVMLSADADGDFDENTFKAHLSASLPHYMVPHFWVHVQSFPFSPNGKIDRKALKPPAACTTTTTATAADVPVIITTTPAIIVSPMSSMEEKNQSPMVALVCQTILSVSGSEVTADSAIASVGIDSLGTMVLVRKLSVACGGIRVPVALLYQLRTVNDLAMRLQETVLEVGDKSIIMKLGLDGSSFRDDTSTVCTTDSYSSVAASGDEKFGAGQQTAHLLIAGRHSLTGLRGVMILWVVFEHFMNRDERAQQGWRMGANTFLFVLLSGLSCFCQAQPAVTAGKWRWMPFLRSRIVGLFPIYYLAILLSFPRYLYVTEDPNAFADPGWKATKGIFETNYSKTKTYIVDGVMYLTGMQTWVQDVNSRGLNGLYYASIQWNLYLLFATAAFSYQILVKWRQKRFGHADASAVMSLPMASFIYIFGVMGILFCLFACAEYFDNKVIDGYSPVQFIPSFIAGILSAWYFNHLVHHALLSLPYWWSFVPENVRRPGWRRVVVGRLWAHSIDLLAAAIIYLVTTKTAMSLHWDLAVYLIIIPFLTSNFVLMLLLTPTDNVAAQPTPFIKYILDSDAANILGQYTYAIYLFHEVIGDVYMQYAVKGLYSLWGGMRPPPDTPW